MKESKLRGLIRRLIKEQIGPLPGPIGQQSLPGGTPPTPPTGPNITTAPVSPATQSGPTGPAGPNTGFPSAQQLQNAIPTVANNEQAVQFINSMSNFTIMQKVGPQRNIPTDIQQLINRPSRVPNGVQKSWALFIFAILFLGRQWGWW